MQRQSLIRVLTRAALATQGDKEAGDLDALYLDLMAAIDGLEAGEPVCPVPGCLSSEVNS